MFPYLERIACLFSDSFFLIHLRQWFSAEHRKDIICNIIPQFFHLQQRLEISVCNHKIYICIVFHMLWIRCFWQSNRSQLQTITNAQLCSRNAVFRCHFCDNRIFQGFPVCNREINFYRICSFLQKSNSAESIFSSIFVLIKILILKIT